MKINLVNLCKAKEISWKQKSREMWVKKGDCNTKYFHVITNNRRIINYITDIYVEGRKVTRNKELRAAAREIFAKLYQEEHMRRPTLDGIKFRKLPESNKILLENEFSENKIKDSLDLCNGDKAAGLD